MYPSGRAHQSSKVEVYPISPYAISRLKAIGDRGFAACLSILCLPVFVWCAALIALSDGLPIFFTQERIGQGGRPFRIVKFRTMRPANGLAITVSSDSRITLSGRFLRSCKLDELPQLWNVLKGEMSVVGPRPEIPLFVERQSSAWAGILKVRPGITSVASLKNYNEIALLSRVDDPIAYYRETLLPEKLSDELRYLKNCSFFSDIWIFLRTAVLFLTNRLGKTTRSE